MITVGMAQIHGCPFLVTAPSLRDAQTTHDPLMHKRSHEVVMTFDGDVDPVLPLITRQSDMADQESCGALDAGKTPSSYPLLSSRLF